MKVGIFSSDYSRKNEQCAERFADELKELGMGSIPVTMDAPEKDIDVLAVFGGDGSILAFCKFAADGGVPVLAFNGGSLGFLSEFEVTETRAAAELLKNGELIGDKRALLKVKCGSEEFCALNDAVIERIYEENYKNLVVRVSASVDGNLVDKIVGDGIIAATPTGSTAYSLSAGGSILSPQLDAFTVTPINAHSLHNRPIVCGSGSTVSLTVREGGKSALFVDGKMRRKLNLGDIVEICDYSKKISFLRKKDFNFYSRLLAKLKYGAER